MDNTAPNGVENGRVLALAGIAAGVVGGLLMALAGRRERKQPEATVTLTATVPPGVVESAQHIREDVGALVSDQLAQAAARGKRARQAAKRRQKKMSKDKAMETGKNSVKDARRSLNPLARHHQENAKKSAGAARQQVAQLAQQGADVTHQARQRLEQLAQQSPASLSDLRQRTVDLAHAGAERAQESARALSQTATERGQAVRSNVAPQVETLKSNVAPQVQSIKSAAGERIDELVAEGRERAETLIKEAETDVLPTVKHLAAQARETLESVAEDLPELKGKADQLKSTASERAAEAQQQVVHLKSAATDRAAAAQQQVGDKTRQVATTTADGGKDVGATLTWLALGGALVYFVFLDDKQREQLRAVGNRVYARAVDTYRDIQGFDQEFA